MVKKFRVFVLAVVQRKAIEQLAFPFNTTNNAMWKSVQQIKPEDAQAGHSSFWNHFAGFQVVLLKKISANLGSFLRDIFFNIASEGKNGIGL